MRKKLLLGFCVLLVSFSLKNIDSVATPVVAAGVLQSSSTLAPKSENCHLDVCDHDCFDCEPSSLLSLHNLCTRNLRVLCALIKELRACDIKTKTLSACDATIKNLEACDIKAKDLGVSGTFLNCTPLKAWLSLKTTYNYTLGGIVVFDTIFDPHGDVSGTPAKYIAPHDGWYLLHAGYEAKNLVTPTPILGTPSADITINIDGSITTTADLATLGWVNRFSNKTMVMVRLKKGAAVSLMINLKEVAGPTASTNVMGTVDLVGSTDYYVTYLAVHYLSSDCNLPNPCKPCATPACKPCTPCGGIPKK